MSNLQAPVGPSVAPPWSDADGPCKDEPKKCEMTPYKPNKCPKGKTGHHAIPVHCFMAPGARSLPKAKRAKKKYEGCDDYNMSKAVVICVEGAGKEKEHGRIHESFDGLEDDPKNKGVWSYKKAEDAAVKSICDETGCKPTCIRAQVKHGHKEMGIADDTTLRADSTGRRKMPKKPSITKKGTGIG